MTTGQRIKAARKAAGMTQKELGDKLNLSFQSIAQWENDLRNPKIETLMRIAKALNVDYALLLGSNEQSYHTRGYISGVKDITDGLMLDFKRLGYTFSEQERTLVAEFHILTDEGQAKAIEHVQELTEIPRYRAETAPQSPPAKDTTTPPESAETPQEPPEGE